MTLAIFRLAVGWEESLGEDVERAGSFDQLRIWLGLADDTPSLKSAARFGESRLETKQTVISRAHATTKVKNAVSSGFRPRYGVVEHQLGRCAAPVFLGSARKVVLDDALGFGEQSRRGNG